LTLVAAAALASVILGAAGLARAILETLGELWP
jgi:hypothetical protein